MYSLWGRLTYEISAERRRVAIATRSGNLDRPQKNWASGPRCPLAQREAPAVGALRAVESHLTAWSSWTWCIA
jgi:hypothetical protein